MPSIVAGPNGAAEKLTVAEPKQRFLGGWRIVLRTQLRNGR
jgi:hypothetical protein